MDKIELLAPAGDYNCFLAAINAGADAVYLSGDRFGARAYAKNFSTEELIKAIDVAHVFDRKVFLTVNTLLKEDEIAELYDFLYPFYEAGLDGVIVQDIGVISYIRRVFKDLPVHASTQLTITGIEGIKLLENLGVKRTVLAREVSMSEIEYICSNSSMEIETFVHGALCYSYSGKCLFSSLVGGRSGNRGRCAGSCRQPYNDGQYLLSTKDICCLDYIPEMINTGIKSLKIEGRMKSPEYVAGVTAIYRKYIDYYYASIGRLSKEDIKNKYFNGKEFNKDKELLTRLYTRGGNSKGYYYKHNGKDMISLTDASYRSDKGELKASVNENYIEGTNKKALSAFVRIYPGQNISILINNELYFEGELAFEAQNRPIDIETVTKQIKKTKDTEFEFVDIDYDIAPNAFVKISDLNDLRRKAIDGYRESILKKYRRKIETNNCVVSNIQYFNGNNKNIAFINCEVTNINQLEAVVNIPEVNGIYVPFDLIDNTSIIDKIRKNSKRLYIKFPSVIRNNYLQKNKDKIVNCFDIIDGVLVDSHEVIQFFLDEGFRKDIIGDVHIYAFNEFAKEQYKKMGVQRLTVPIELNKKETLKRNFHEDELIIYGYLPMMLSAQCVNNTTNGCTKTENIINLKDRKGAEFKAVNMCSTCLNVIYNNVPLAYQGEKDYIRKLNPKSLRLTFTIESPEEVIRVVNYFVDYLIYENNSKEPLLSDNCFTKGHLNRGVL